MSDSKPYQSPVPPFGLVLWATNPGAKDWYPALVTRRSSSAISVMVVPEESKIGMPKDAVLHVSDPRFAQLMDQSSGVWDYTEESRLLQSLTRFVLDAGDEGPELANLTKLANRLVK